MSDKRIAMSIWEGRVCTVFDYAQRLLVVNFENRKKPWRKEYSMENVPPLIRASRLLHLDVQVLIRGAVSRSLANLVKNNGISFIPFVCGEIEDVLNAYIDGSISSPRFCLPGCAKHLDGYRKDLGRVHPESKKELNSCAGRKHAPSYMSMTWIPRQYQERQSIYK